MYVCMYLLILSVSHTLLLLLLRQASRFYFFYTLLFPLFSLSSAALFDFSFFFVLQHKKKLTDDVLSMHENMMERFQGLPSLTSSLFMMVQDVVTKNGEVSGDDSDSTCVRYNNYCCQEYE